MFDGSLLLDLADKLGIIQKVKQKLFNTSDEAADKLVIVLQEISKIWMSVDKELVDFLTLDFDEAFLKEERAVLLTLEGGSISVRVNEARGHCHKIGKIYDNCLSGWFNQILGSDEAGELKQIFELLGKRDDYMILQIEQVVDWLGPKAIEVLNLVDADKLNEAKRQVRSARKEIAPFRQEVAKLLYDLTALQTEFIAVSGAV